jgi:hypothetical protein
VVRDHEISRLKKIRSLAPYALRVRAVSLPLIKWQYKVRTIHHNTVRYVVFSSILLPSLQSFFVRISMLPQESGPKQVVQCGAVFGRWKTQTVA